MIRKTRELSTFLRLKVDSSLPKHCLLCLSSGHNLSVCPDCAADFPLPSSGCQICGETLSACSLTANCGHCLSQRPAYRYCRSAFRYAFPVDRLIKGLKYHEQSFWAAPLADLAWPVFAHHFGYLRNAILIPVPMHQQQYRKRRDNHAELIARRLGAHSGLRVDASLIIKHQNATRQAELSGKARRKNLKNAFSLNKGQLPLGLSQHPETPLIIIDDVTTTGTTINTIAKLIKSASDNPVYGFTIAKRSLSD